jgi:hypothetical protein
VGEAVDEFQAVAEGTVGCDMEGPQPGDEERPRAIQSDDTEHEPGEHQTGGDDVRVDRVVGRRPDPRASEVAERREVEGEERDEGPPPPASVTKKAARIATASRPFSMR